MTIARTLQKLQPYLIASAGTLTYENDSYTGTTVKSAIDWIFASLYPNTQDSVDIPSDLPASGNTINDYRVVLDDGDGKAAGYRWEQREGEVSPSWHKIHDMDWSSDAILAAFSDIAHELYVHKYGRTDTDDSGNPITGLYAGQTIYGGNASGQNLTLNANSGDETGPQSGYVQSDNTIRPTSDNALDLGTTTEQFRDIFFSGSLRSGIISITMADIVSAIVHSEITDGSNPHQTSYDTLSTKLGALSLDGDATGSVDLSASGDATLTVTVVDDSHNHTASTVTDIDTAVYNKTKLILQDIDGLSFVPVDADEEIIPVLDLNTSHLSDVDPPSTNKILASGPSGTSWVASVGTINLSGEVSGSATYVSTDQGWDIDATVESVGLNAQLWINYATLSWTSLAGSPTVITSNDHGVLTGETVNVIGNFFSGVFTATRIDANTFSIAHDSTSDGDDYGYYIPQYAQLLYDPTTDKFLVTKEYTAISHSEISGLTTRDDHTQYVAIGGRAGGQTIKGGVAASQNLTLQSTDNATRGYIKAEDTLVPVTDAAYSGGWTGTDLGGSSNRWNDLYMAGEAKGLRAENLGTLPSNSGTTIGRMIFVAGLPYWDTGTEWVSGAGGGGIVTKTGNYTATEDDDLIICDGTFTVSLPDAASLDPGDSIVIKNIGTGTISIDPFSSQTLDGVTLMDIVDQWACLHLVCDGSNWVII